MYAFQEELQPGQPTLRIGDRVPNDAVNLAYVRGPQLVSSETVELFDYSQRVPENSVVADTFQSDMYVTDTRMLENAKGGAMVPVDNLLVTSIYKHVDGKLVPMYYAYRPRFFHYEVNPPIKDGYYVGQNVRILEGTSPTTKNYLVKLTPTATSNVWTVDIYSDFTSSKETQYVLQYSKCDSTGQNRLYMFEEIYASSPLYTKTDLDTVLSAPLGSHLFATDKSLQEDGYAVYVADATVPIARSPVWFRWRACKDGTTYIPWRVDSVCRYESLFEEEYTSKPGYTAPYTVEDGVAKKLVCPNIRSLFNGQQGTFVLEYQVWNGTSLTSGSWVSDASGVLSLVLVDNTKVYASTTADTGSLAGDEGLLKQSYPVANIDLTIEGYNDPIDPVIPAGSLVNVAKLSRGATATSNLNPSQFPTHSQENATIDGVSVFPNIFHWFTFYNGIWYARSSESPNPPEASVVLTINLGTTRTINRIEIVMGDRGKITKLETVNGGTVTTIWANESSVPPPLPFLLRMRQGRHYVYNAPSPITCDAIKVTVQATKWKTRDYPWIVELLLGWLGLRDQYMTGFDVYEVNAYAITSDPVEPIKWHKLASFGVTTRCGSPLQLDMREVLRQYDLLPPAGVNLGNVKYKIWLGDRTQGAAVDYHAAVWLDVCRASIVGGVSLSPSSVVTLTSAQAGEDCIPVTYNDIMGSNSSTVLVSVMSGLEAPTFSKLFTVTSGVNNRIYILPFEDAGANDMWLPRINNGRVVRKDFVSSTIYDYYIPEFGVQPFYPYEPYMYQEGELTAYINSRTVRVACTPMYVVTDGNGAPTNLRVYRVIEGSKVDLPVVTWNQYTGEIRLGAYVSFQDKVYCDYSYVMTYYAYKGYGDPELNKFFYLDLNPLPGHVYTYPLDASGIERPSSELLGKAIYLYVMPSYSYNYITHTSTGLTTTAVRHIIVDDDTPEQDVLDGLPDGAMVLGKILVRRNVVPSMVQCIDTRRRGGGFRDDLTRSQVSNLHQDTEFIWDLGPWDGLPYPCNSVIEVTLPRSILKDPALLPEQNIGKFSDAEIRDIIKRYVAFGTYVFTQYV